MRADVKQILEEDPLFNTYFLTEQKERVQRKDALRRQNCKERHSSEEQIWTPWVKNYLEERAKSKEKVINNPKYSLLNFIAK